MAAFHHPYRNVSSKLYQRTGSRVARPEIRRTLGKAENLSHCYPPGLCASSEIPGSGRAVHIQRLPSLLILVAIFGLGKPIRHKRAVDVMMILRCRAAQFWRFVHQLEVDRKSVV